MRFFNKIKGLKLVALLAAMATCLVAGAENKVYIEPFTITDYEPVDVPVYMDNDVEVMGLQFRFDLPTELEIVGEPEMNSDRLSNGQELSFGGAGVIVTSWEEQPIAGNSGAIMTVKLRVKEGMLTSKKVILGLSKIEMTDRNNKVIPAEVKQETEVTLVGQENKYVFTTPASEVVVTPGTSFPIEVSMENNVALGGLQFLVTLPQGCDIKTSEIKLSNRLTNGSRMRRTVRPDGTLAFTLMDLNSTKIAEPGEGLLFTFNVSVPENFDVYDGTFKFFDVVASTIPDAEGMTTGVNCEGFTVKLVNNSMYNSDAQTVIAGLRNDLAAAIATIAESCPDVKDNFTGAEITAAIEAIEAAVSEALANGSLAANYDAIVSQPAAAVSASISKLIEDAKAAQEEWEAKRVADNKAAYEATVKTLDELQAKLDAAKTKVAETYPDFDATELVKAAQDAIDKARGEALAAYEAVATAGKYEYTVDSEAIETLISAIESAAEAARVAANEEAYNATLAEIAELQKSLDDMKTAVAESYPGIDVTEAEEAAQAAIDKTKTDAEAAYEAVATEGNYEFSIDSEAIKALIDAIETAAKAASDERIAANEAAYNASLADLTALQEALDAMKAKVAETYPDADVTTETTAAQDAINKAKEEADAAHAAVADEGIYEYKVDIEAIEALINAIEVSAEAQRVAANEAAYNASLAEIETLKTKLENMKTAVSVTYPNVDVESYITAATDAIAQAKADADAAFEAVATEGKYEYKVDVEAIEALIEAIRVEAARISDNDTAYNAVLNTLAGLQDKLDNMKLLVSVNYPSADVTVEITAAQEAIDNAKADADEALEAVASEGSFDYTVDTAAIEELIEKILEAAQSMGITDIEIEAADGVKYFNLQGVRILNPEKGVMLIRITPDGKAEKVIL